MTLADERILEYLSEQSMGTPSVIAEDDRIRYDRQYIGHRIRKLTDVGLAVRIGRGVYQITEEGEAYLTGDFDARDLDEPE